MIDTELGLKLSGRLARDECFICGKSLVESEKSTLVEHSKFGIVGVHKEHIKILCLEEK
jgi:hypothetical protein